MRCPRQEYWNGFPFPSPGDLANPGTGSTSASAGRFFTTEPYVVGSLLHKGSREEALCNIKAYIKAHLLSIYHVPGSILNPPPVLYHLRQKPHEANYTNAHFTDRETESHEADLPRLSLILAKPRFKSKTIWGRGQCHTAFTEKAQGLRPLVAQWLRLHAPNAGSPG